MKSFSKTYAASLFSLCEEENLTGVIMDDIKTASTVFEENKEYAVILDSPVIPQNERLSLIDGAFSSLHEYVGNFIKILCEKKSVYLFPSCAKEFELLYNKKNDIEKVTAITATKLNDRLSQKLVEKLEEQTGRKIVLECKVDPSLIGGIVLRTENSQTDASVRLRLDKILASLSSAEI